MGRNQGCARARLPETPGGRPRGTENGAIRFVNSIPPSALTEESVDRILRPVEPQRVFFLREEEALASNYRPCRRCKPDLFPDSRPLWINRCLQFLHENTDKKVSDSELVELVGVEVSTLRRNFAAAFEKTPAGYHREVRLRKAASSLSRRMPVLQVAVEIGFESLSGFSDAFRK